MVRPSESGQGTSAADNDYVLTFEPVAPDCDDDVICVAEKRYKDGVRPPPRPTPIDWDRNDCEIVGEIVTNTQNGPCGVPEVVYVGDNLGGFGGWRLRLPRAPAAAARLDIRNWPADGETGKAIAMSLQKIVPTEPHQIPAEAAPSSEQNSHNAPVPHDAAQAATVQIEAATEERDRENDDMAPMPVPVGRGAIAAPPIAPDTPSLETNSLAAEDEETAVLRELTEKVEAGQKREEEAESETSFKADQDKPAVGFTQHTQVEHTQILAVGDDDCMLVGELVPIEHEEPIAPDNEEDCVVMKTVVHPERAHTKKRGREEGMDGYDPKRVKMELEELREEEARRMEEKASERTRLASLYPQYRPAGFTDRTRWLGKK